MKLDLKPNYKNKYHDFDMLKGCFGNTKIMPTDIDCAIETNRHFLFIEFKIYGQSVPYGQGLLLVRLSKIKNMTVLIVWHKPCEQHCKKEPLAMQKLPDGGLVDINEGDLREFVARWFANANKN